MQSGGNLRSSLAGWCTLAAECTSSLEVEEFKVGQLLNTLVNSDSLQCQAKSTHQQDDGSSLREEQLEVKVPGPPGWRLGVELEIPPHENQNCSGTKG